MTGGLSNTKYIVADTADDLVEQAERRGWGLYVKHRSIHDSLATYDYWMAPNEMVYILADALIWIGSHTRRAGDVWGNPTNPPEPKRPATGMTRH